MTHGASEGGLQIWHAPVELGTSNHSLSKTGVGRTEAGAPDTYHMLALLQ